MMKRDLRGRLFGFTGIIAVVAITILVSLGARRDNGSDISQTIGSFEQEIKSFAVPDSISFAGEPVPVENFDTHESFDRELNSNAYFHSSTLLLIKRANRYFPEIEPVLAEYGIPDDFKYIAVAESNLTNAISPAGAVGFWQFLKGTGKEYGLEISNEIDERYNIIRSTEAACRYFLKSYEKYGNWTMVAASYNRGKNGIDKQVEIQHETNYYDLLLPEETARYIFRILSFKLIFTDPSKYGFDIEKEHLYPEISYKTVTIDTAVTDFALLAKQFGTNYKILKTLNPWLRKPYLTNPNLKKYSIRIPSEGARTEAYKK